jgi:hypothetical protein
MLTEFVVVVDVARPIREPDHRPEMLRSPIAHFWQIVTLLERFLSRSLREPRHRVAYYGFAQKL